MVDPYELTLFAAIFGMIAHLEYRMDQLIKGVNRKK